LKIRFLLIYKDLTVLSELDFNPTGYKALTWLHTRPWAGNEEVWQICQEDPIAFWLATCHYVLGGEITTIHMTQQMVQLIWL